jgi:hypothetical protein
MGLDNKYMETIFNCTGVHSRIIENFIGQG